MFVNHLVSLNGDGFVPGVIEDELITVFCRLNADMLACWQEDNSSEVYTELKDIATAIIDAKPSNTTLGAIKIYLDILLEEIDYFVWKSQEQLWSAVDGPMDLMHPLPQSEREESHMRTYKKGLLQWWEASRSFRTKSHPFVGNEFLLVLSLSLRYTCQ